MNAIPGTFPPGKSQPRPTDHRIADIRQSKPFWVLCTCGFAYKGIDGFDIEAAWRRHKAEVNSEPAR